MIEDIEGIDPKMMQEIMEQFERIKKEAGIEPDDDSKKEIEDSFNIDFFLKNIETIYKRVGI